MTIGSLFSGIGGLELGLEWAGLGPTIWQVENNADCRTVLSHHWPEATRFDDVTTVGRANLAPVDTICGGFPCQDVSSAGKRSGLGGARSGLWYEFARVVEECHPRWVVVENVASGAIAWVDAVCSDLERAGYAAFPIPLAAGDVGAPHQRARVFVVAHAHSRGRHAVAEHAEVACAPESADTFFGVLWDEPRRRRGAGGPGAPEPATDGDPLRARREGPEREGRRSRIAGWRPPIPDMVRVVHGVPRRLDGARARIAALGNSVAPQQAEVIGTMIRQLEAV